MIQKTTALGLSVTATSARPVMSRVERMQMEAMGKSAENLTPLKTSPNVIVKQQQQQQQQQGVKRKAMMEGISPRGPTAPVGAKEICGGVGGVGDGGVAQLMLPALKSLIVTFDCKKVRM